MTTSRSTASEPLRRRVTSVWFSLFLTLAGAGSTLATPPNDAPDWPQFRGPGGQGHAVGKGYPALLRPDRGVVWKTAIPGRGWSSPVVGGGLIWITAATERAHSLRAIAVDFGGGAIRHDVEAIRCERPVDVNAKNSHASPSPVLAGGKLFVHFGSMGTAAIDVASGKVLWRNLDHVVDHKEGPGSSLIVHKDLVIVTLDGMDRQYLVALKQTDGTVAWKTDRSGHLADNPDFRKAFGTPLIFESEGRMQLVSPGAKQVVSYDPDTGRELWKVKYDGFSTTARPVYAGGMVIVSSGFPKAELHAIRPNGSGDVSKTHVVWKQIEGMPSAPSPLVADDLIYVVSDKGIVSCLDLATGKPVWKARVPGNYSASPVLAGGRIHLVSEYGDTVSLAAGRETPTVEKSRFLDGLAEPAPAKTDPKEAAKDLKMFSVGEGKGQILATPAFTGGSVILRTGTHLYRLEEPAEAASR
jgi:outer membrane protein assembly factor BamB